MILRAHHRAVPGTRGRRLGALVTALALLAGLASSVARPPAAAATPPPNTGNSLWVLAYNTAFLWADLPGACGSIDINGETIGGFDYEERAHLIAEAVKKTDNDVVVLSEVFSDPVKDQLVKELKGAYPNYVSKIAKPLQVEIANPLLAGLLGPAVAPCLDLAPTTTFTSADSGLMIFVKNGLSFATFSSQATPPHDVTTVIGRNKGAPWGQAGEVAVDTYDRFGDGIFDQGECEGSDCLSSKAAAMVRVRNDTTNLVHNVAFSHTQAWNGPDQVKAREEQFGVIKDLLRNSLTPAEAVSQPVYLTGDLNVPGENPATVSKGSEWTKLFDSSSSSSGSFFACGQGPCTASATNTNGSLLSDGWAFDQPVQDPGITNAEDQMRLDYFLHNYRVASPIGSATRFCLQHLTKAYDLEQGPAPLSDHLGIRADVNLQAPQCSPNGALGPLGPKPVAFDVNGNFQVSGKVTFPGSVQWYRLDQGAGWDTGSYVFSGSSSKFDLGIDVYQTSDMSQPIPMFDKDASDRWVKYSLPERPYLIKVYARNKATHEPDRTLSGSYTFTVHENRGLTPGDAIAMKPGFENAYPWPAIPLNQASAQKDNVTFTPDTQIWHELFTDSTTSGGFPDVSFLSENSSGIDPGVKNPPFSMALRPDAKNQPIATQLDQAPGDAQGNGVHDHDLDGNADYRLDAPDLPGTGNGPRKYFLTVTRNTPAELDDVTSYTTFATTMTYVRSMDVFVWNDTTGWGDDEVNFRWAYDVPTMPLCIGVKGAACVGPVSLSDGQHWKPGDGSFMGSFATALVPQLWEDGMGLQPRYADTISALSSAEPHRQFAERHWSNGSNPDDGDYWYTLKACVGHERADTELCKLDQYDWWAPS